MDCCPVELLHSYTVALLQYCAVSMCTGHTVLGHFKPPAGYYTSLYQLSINGVSPPPAAAHPGQLLLDTAPSTPLLSPTFEEIC